jgi:hypothetical protein
MFRHKTEFYFFPRNRIMAFSINGENDKIYDLRELLDRIAESFRGIKKSENEFVSDGFVIDTYNGEFEIYSCHALKYGNGHIVKINSNRCLVRYIETNFPKNKIPKLISGRFWMHEGILYDLKGFSGNANYIIIYSHGLIVCARIVQYRYRRCFTETNYSFVEEMKKDICSGKISLFETD